jgi:hypothetical protein
MPVGVMSQRDRSPLNQNSVRLDEFRDLGGTTILEEPLSKQIICDLSSDICHL